MAVDEVTTMLLGSHFLLNFASNFLSIGLNFQYNYKSRSQMEQNFQKKMLEIDFRIPKTLKLTYFKAFRH